MSALTDDLAHIRDQIRAARDQLRAAGPAVRAASARLDEALPAPQAVVDQLNQLQTAALHTPALQAAQLVAQPGGTTTAQVTAATGRSLAWVLRLLNTWVEAGVAVKLGDGRYTASSIDRSPSSGC